MIERSVETVERGAYIHIPFCEHICYYCDFNKFLIRNQPVDRYLRALAREMAYYASQGPVRTIYIGGGTPSALNVNQLNRLLDDVCANFLTDAVQEFTLEANPENLTDQKLKIMKEHGVNRLSIGVQSFDDHLLQAIGRTHGRKQIDEAISRARKTGFDNLSLDLMFALPGQTEMDLQHSLEAAFAFEPSHLSVYSLQIEPRTILFNRLRDGKLRLPGEDIEADMFARIIFEMEKHGWHHYEISNFARAGCEGIHNSLYWENKEYYGIGAGAHGYIDRQRYANTRSLKKYCERVEQTACARTVEHSVSRRECIEEQLFLGLRLMRGVNKEDFRKKFGCSIEDIYQKRIEDLKGRGLLEETAQVIRLTTRGIFLGNNVFEAFLLS